MSDLLPKSFDLSNQGIRKLPKDLPSPDTCLELNVDSNEFTRLENFDQFKRLRKVTIDALIFNYYLQKFLIFYSFPLDTIDLLKSLD